MEINKEQYRTSGAGNTKGVSLTDDELKSYYPVALRTDVIRSKTGTKMVIQRMICQRIGMAIPFKAPNKNGKLVNGSMIEGNEILVDLPNTYFNTELVVAQAYLDKTTLEERLNLMESTSRNFANLNDIILDSSAAMKNIQKIAKETAENQLGMQNYYNELTQDNPKVGELMQAINYQLTSMEGQHSLYALIKNGKFTADTIVKKSETASGWTVYNLYI